MLRSPSRLLRCFLIALACACFGFAGADLAPAQAEAVWKVHGKLLGKPRDNGVGSKEAEDVSGMACATTAGFPRLCLVGDDEAQGVQIVILKDGALIAGDFIRLIDDVHNGKPVELDAEGIAFADGAFYVIGSHGRPRHPDAAGESQDKAKAEASQRVFRIRLDAAMVNLKTGKLTGTPEIQVSRELVDLIQAEPVLAPWFDRPLSDNGLTIEGVAVRAGMLHAAMRGPVLASGEAAILTVPTATLFDGQPGVGSLRTVSLGSDTSNKARGIRDLVAYDGGFLIIAGPVNDPPDGTGIKRGDYSIYFEDPTGRSERRLDLDRYGEKVKPEAIVPLSEANGRLRALLLFDGPKAGAPRPVVFKVR